MRRLVCLLVITLLAPSCGESDTIRQDILIGSGGRLLFDTAENAALYRAESLTSDLMALLRREGLPDTAQVVASINGLPTRIPDAAYAERWRWGQATILLSLRGIKAERLPVGISALADRVRTLMAPHMLAGASPVIKATD